jgi:hypothetical protein
MFFTLFFKLRRFIMTAKHVLVIDKKVTALSDALANLGKGTDLKELLRIIRFPGWTTPAEFAMMSAMLDSMNAQAAQLQKFQSAMLGAAKKVAVKG